MAWQPTLSLNNTQDTPTQWKPILSVGSSVTPTVSQPVSPPITAQPPKKNLFLETLKGIPQAFADVVGAPFLRSTAAIGAKIASGDVNASFTPQGDFQKALYGTDQPINFSSKANELGVKNKFVAPILGAGLSVADILPYGKSVEEASKVIAGSKDAGVIFNTIKNTFKAADTPETRALAEQLVNVTNPQEVTTILNGAKDMLAVAKTVPQETSQFITRVAQTEPKIAVDNALQPLAQEARKYKSAEEFVKAMGVKEIPSADSRLLYHVSETPNITELKPQTNGSRGVFVTPGEPSRSNGYVYAIDRTKLPEGVLKQDPSQARDLYINAPIPKEAVISMGKIENGKLNKVSQLTDFYNKVIKVTTKTPAQVAVAKTVPQETSQFITRVAQTEPKIADSLKGLYNVRNTAELAQKAQNLIKDDIQAAHYVVNHDTGEKAVAVASELVAHYTKLAESAQTTGEAALLYDKAISVANTIAPKLTELGRGVQAASIYGKLTPEGIIRFAASEISKYNATARTKIPQLTADVAKQLTDEATKLRMMPDGEEKAMAFKQLSDKVAKLIPSSLYSKVISVWKAGLLTGIKTSGLNIMANVAHGITENIKDIPAAAVDSVASLFTKERTVAATAKGTLSGIQEGFKRGFQYFKTGYDRRDVATKLDFKIVNFGTGKFAKALQTYEQTIFRILGAEDQPFYYGAKARSLYSQAIAQAKNTGVKGKEIANYANSLVKNPTDEMLKNAVNDAEIAIFQNRTLLGKAASAIQKIPGGEVVVPFGRTPSAVATQIVNYTPVGLVAEIAKQIIVGKFDQRAFSQMAGRAITGTGAIYLGQQLYKKGLISLGYPSSQNEQAQQQIEGKVPNAILIGGKYRTVASLGPIGNIILIGGYFQKALDEQGSPTAALTQAFSGSAKSLTEQTFLTGLSSFINAMNDPTRYADALAKRTVGSVVPTIVSDIARSTDTVNRETPTIPSAIATRIPGLRENLNPQVNVLGQPIQRQGNPFETMADPTRPSNVIATPVVNELKRLSDIGMIATPTKMNDSKALNADQNNTLRQYAGKLLNDKLGKLIQTPQYQSMPDEEKQKTIQDFSTKAHLYGKVKLLDDMLSSKTPEQQKLILTTLKAGGFLTKTVYDAWNNQ